MKPTSKREDLRLAQAEAVLKAFIRAALSLPVEADVSVFTWKPSADGIRVAKVGYYVPKTATTGAGAAWMASDADAAGVILEAERFLIAWQPDHEHRESVGDEPDWLCEGAERLYYHLTGKPRATGVEDLVAAASGVAEESHE